MPSLEFENLPLIQVDLRLSIDLPGPIPAHIAFSLREAFRERFPDVVPLQNLELAPGALQTSPVLDPLGLAAVAFGCRKPMVVAIVQEDVLTVRWVKQAEDSDYPRYQSLKDHLAWGLDQVRAATGVPATVSVVQMRYSNFVAKDAADGLFVFDYLAGEQCTHLRPDVDRLNTYEVVWSTGATDLKLTTKRATLTSAPHEVGIELTTVAGRFVKTDDWVEPLDGCHDELNLTFERIISSKAKEEWGYRSAG